MSETVKQLGLIGKPLSHSFSKSYFTKKFDQLGLKDFQYVHYELQSIGELLPLLKRVPNLIGLNVTIPYKMEVIRYMDHLSKEATLIGAVNVIKVESGTLTGFNSDYYGFRSSLLSCLGENWQGKALVLGTGGASLAVVAVLNHLQIPFQLISRQAGDNRVTYKQAKEMELVANCKLVINTTPLGMHPNIKALPDLDYQKISTEHFLFDLVYNPETTAFMAKGMERGAKVKNGLEMLQLQAEKSWEIWTGS